MPGANNETHRQLRVGEHRPKTVDVGAICTLFDLWMLDVIGLTALGLPIETELLGKQRIRLFFGGGSDDEAEVN